VPGEIVNVLVPVPLLVNVTAGALAVTNVAELVVAASVTVPA
jgi:hypothetical protein